MTISTESRLCLIISLALFLVLSTKISAQCTAANSFSNATAPVRSNIEVPFSSCALDNEFLTANDLDAGRTYRLRFTGFTGNIFVSLYAGGVARGPAFLTQTVQDTLRFTAPISGRYEIVPKRNAACAALPANACVEATIECLDCPGLQGSDTCQTAALIDEGSYAFTPQGANGMDLSSCAPNDVVDRWVRYKAPRDGTATFSTCYAGFNTTLQLYDGCPEIGGTELACNDQSESTELFGGVDCPNNSESTLHVAVDSGETYLLRIGTYTQLNDTGRFRMSDPVAPTGVNCTSALLLEPNGSFRINMAQFDANLGEVSAGDPLCGNLGSNFGVFFRVIVPQSGRIRLTMSHLSSSFNWFLLNGDCGAQAVGVNGGISSGCAPAGTRVFEADAKDIFYRSALGALTNGQTPVPSNYLLYIEPSGGLGTLNVSYQLLDACAPPNHDFRLSPREIILNEGFAPINLPAAALLDSNTCATTGPADDNSAAKISPGTPACNFELDNTLWYSWVAPDTDDYAIQIFDQSCQTFSGAPTTGIQFFVTTDIGSLDPAVVRDNIVVATDGTPCANSGTTNASSLIFTARKDSQYYFVLDGASAAACSYKLLITPASSFLPVEGLQLYGSDSSGGFMLRWYTRAEVNVSHFEVQRSIDGGMFERLGNVSATGRPTNYRTFDPRPPAGGAIYRIKAIDTDGRFTYSNLVHLRSLAPDPFQLYPNPVSDILMLDLAFPVAGGTLSLFDIRGRLVYRKAWNHAPPYRISPDLAAGVYRYAFRAGDFYRQGKLIKR